MGSDESHFYVSLNVTDKVTRQCPQTTTFEQKGEPKRIRIEVLLLTILTHYRQAKPTHIIMIFISSWIFYVDSGMTITHRIFIRATSVYTIMRPVLLSVAAVSADT